MNKILSISVAAYNVEDVIKQCLDSLVQSRYLDDIEIIVVNDGSKDNTAKIVKGYQQRWPESIFLLDKENGGHGSTINEALRFAHGKYFKLLDGDDWVDVYEFDGFVEDLLECEADLMVNDYREVYAEKKIRVNVTGEYTAKIKKDIECMNLNNIFPMHSITVKTDKLRNRNFPMSSNRFYADTEYIFLVFSVVRTFSVSNKCVYQYRLGIEGQSVSPSGIYNHIEDMLYIEYRLIEEYMRYDNHPNQKILWNFVSSKYILIYRLFVIMKKADKIGQLETFDKKVRQTYPEFFKNINLGKYDLVKYNYHFVIKFYRILYKIKYYILHN